MILQIRSSAAANRVLPSHICPLPFVAEFPSVFAVPVMLLCFSSNRFISRTNRRAYTGAVKKRTDFVLFYTIYKKPIGVVLVPFKSHSVFPAVYYVHHFMHIANAVFTEFCLLQNLHLPPANRLPEDAASLPPPRLFCCRTSRSALCRRFW